MNTFTRIKRYRKDDDSGLTLVELLVASSIFSLITIAVLNVIGNFETVRQSVSTNTQATSNAMVTFNRIALDIRNAVIPTGSGSPIIYNSPSQLELYTTNGAGSPITVCMIVQSTGSTSGSTCPNTTASTSCPCTLNEYVVGSSNTYRYSVDGLTSPNVFTYIAPPLNSGSSIAIESIQLNATLAPLANQPSATVQNTIEMRNVALANG